VDRLDVTDDDGMMAVGSGQPLGTGGHRHEGDLQAGDVSYLEFGRDGARAVYVLRLDRAADGLLRAEGPVAVDQIRAPRGALQGPVGEDLAMDEPVECPSDRSSTCILRAARRSIGRRRYLVEAAAKGRPRCGSGTAQARRAARHRAGGARTASARSRVLMTPRRSGRDDQQVKQA
jgi:hypothetical protein